MGASDKSDRALSASPTEPVPVSSADAVTIPSAKKRSLPVYITEQSHANIEREARKAMMTKSAFFLMLARKGTAVWKAEEAAKEAPPPPEPTDSRVMQLDPIRKDGLLLAALNNEWRTLRSLNLAGKPRLWIQTVQRLQRAGLAESRYRSSQSGQEYRLTAQGMSAGTAETRNAAQGEARQPGPAEQDAP